MKLNPIKNFVKSSLKEVANVFRESRQTRAKEGKITRWRETKYTIFGKKPYLTRKEFIQRLQKTPKVIPGIGKISEEEKLEIPDMLYPKKEVGTFITPYEYKRGIRRLKKLVHRTPSLREKQELRKKIKFLQYLIGQQDEK